MKLLTIMSAIILLSYPFAIYFGIEKLGIQAIAVLLLIPFAIRIFSGANAKLKELKYIAWTTGVVGILLLLLSALFNHQGWLTYYPVVVNTILFVLFCSSLWQPQTIVERFARLQQAHLPESAIRYTRNVTKIWCLFFVVNGSIALITCFLPLSIWTLYNGLISYVAIGTLATIEYIVRKHVQKKLQQQEQNY